MSEAARPDVLVPAPSEASEVARRIAEAAIDAYTKEDWHYVLNALRPDRAARYISNRPPEERLELLLLIESPNRRSRYYQSF